MARINKKEVKERANQVDDAWSGGAPGVEFMGHKLGDLKNLLSEILTEESLIEEDKAKIKNRETALEPKYRQLSSMLVDVRNGVVGDKNFGEDSPLYGGMGYVLKSERKSGLTRKKKDENPA